MKRTVRVELGQRSYDVSIGSGLLSQLGQTVRSLDASRAVVIGDDTVAGLYAPAAMDSLKQAGVTTSSIAFGHGEADKTLRTYCRIFDDLFALRPAVDRKSVIVALGGGVSGDMAGFVAATALRGLRWIQCPTTLLADVDASVGGKTGVDHQAGKNLIGAFHQPQAVLIDVSTLKSLPAPELRNGLAECVKHGVICDEGLLDLLERLAGTITQCPSDVMIDLVARNVAIKAAVVSADEMESGQRAHLNFGHTVGHALETLANYRMPHGAAVSLGMAAACRLAVGMGLIDAAYTTRIESLLTALGLPVAQEGIDVEAVLGVMRHDKKARDGRIRMVLPTGPGKVDVFGEIEPGKLADAIQSLAGRR